MTDLGNRELAGKYLDAAKSGLIINKPVRTTRPDSDDRAQDAFEQRDAILQALIAATYAQLAVADAMTAAKS